MKLRFLGPPKVGEKQCTLVNTTTFGRKNKKKKVGENNGQLRFVRHHGLRTQASLDQKKVCVKNDQLRLRMPPRVCVPIASYRTHPHKHVQAYVLTIVNTDSRSFFAFNPLRGYSGS